MPIPPFSLPLFFGILVRMFSHTLARLRRVQWEKVSQGALLILLALVILWRGGRTLEMTLLLSFVACAIVLFKGNRNSETERMVPSAIWWIVMFSVLWTAVSYMLTSTMNYGFDEVAQTLSLALLFFWIMRCPDEAKIRMSILHVLVVTVLLSCLIGVLIYASGPLNRFVGTFLDVRAPWKNAWPNACAELLLLAWPVALLLSHPVREQGRGVVDTSWKIAKRTTPAGVMVGCLLLTFSRAAFLVFLVQGMLLLLWAVKCSMAWKRVAAVVVGTLMIGLIIFGLSNHLRSRAHAVQSLSERTLFLTPEGTGSITERRAFWSQSFVLALERPFFGWGPGSFRFAQTSLMDDVLATSDHSHNVFLKAAMERGWPVALLLFALMCIVLLPFFKAITPACRRFASCPLQRVFSHIPRREFTGAQVLLFTAFTGVFVHNLVDFNLHFIAVSLPTVLILGMLIQPASGKSNKKFVHISEFALAVILLAAVLHESFFAVTSTLARRADAQNKMTQSLWWYRWSAGEWYTRDLPLNLARLQLRSGSPQVALGTISRYTEVTNSIDARGWILQAEIAGQLKDTALAKRSYEQAFALGRYTDLRILHGLLPLLSLESTTVLEDRKEEFTGVMKHFYNAILHNSHYVALTPNVEEFMSVAEIMATIYPSEAPRYQVMAASVDRQAKTERLRQAQLLP